MSVARRIALLLLVLVTLAVDQETKHLARTRLAAGGPLHYGNGILTLVYTENAGAFLSIGSTLPRRIRRIVFDGLVAIGLAMAAFALFTGRMQPGSDDIAIALIIGGGTGNLIDRLLFHGRVTDFIFLAAGSLHTGVFNIADFAITTGVVWLALAWAMVPLLKKRVGVSE